MFKKDIEISRKKASSNLTHMMLMANHVTINVETPMIDSSISLKENLIKLIRINP